MSQQAVAEPTLKKKEVRRQVTEKLTGALSEYKEELGEKKLTTYVKKASKLISRDLLKSSKKNHQRKAKTVKVKSAGKVKIVKAGGKPKD